jgi:hypothetical protein
MMALVQLCRAVNRGSYQRKSATIAISARY